MWPGGRPDHCRPRLREPSWSKDDVGEERTPLGATSTSERSSFGLGPAADLMANSPWFPLPKTRHVGVFVAGTLRSGERLRVEWGRSDVKTMRFIAAQELRDQRPKTADVSPWRFVPASELGRPPRAATAVRLTLKSVDAPGSAIAVTGPVVYANSRFEQVLRRSRASALVSPGLLTYIPCVHQPELRNGVADVPGFVVSVIKFTDVPVGYETSPFRGVADVYDLERLALDGSNQGLADVAIFAVDRRIPGAELVRPERVSVVS